MIVFNILGIEEGNRFGATWSSFGCEIVIRIQVLVNFFHNNDHCSETQVHLQFFNYCFIFVAEMLELDFFLSKQILKLLSVIAKRISFIEFYRHRVRQYFLS